MSMTQGLLDKARRWPVVCLSLVAAIGCSGGGNGDEPGAATDEDPVGGIDGGGRRIFAIGPINGFGSVVVNGVRYDTSAAVITADGTTATETDLRVGQIVRVTGSGPEGSEAADAVEFDDNVEGPISAIDPAAGRLTVLGQSILVNAATSLDAGGGDDSLEALAEGDVVEVSGYVTTDAQILATRIDRTDSSDFEVFGRAADPDTALFTFRINDLTVDYSQANLEGFAGGEIADGDLVDVRGGTLSANDSLLAERVLRVADVAELDLDDSDIDVEGFITDFVSATEFVVTGIPVTTDASTTFEDGTAADLGPDVLVEVEGELDADGRLLARSIEIEDDGFAEISAAVESVDAASGEIVMLGISIFTEADTRFEDDSDLELRNFSIDDISPGDWLEITGAQDDEGSNSVRARTVEREDGEDEVSVQGIAADLMEPEFRILGVRVLTDGNTEFDDTDPNTFFAQGEGLVVEVEGSWDGSRLLASEVEIEEEPSPD